MLRYNASMGHPSGGRRHLKDAAFMEVHALLLSGELPPGSFISERQLVARLGMSKTPIRVAMERLARDGFVEILAQRGVRVRELDLRQIVEHYELREALETWTVRRVADRITDEQLGHLRTLVVRQRELRERVDAGEGRLDPAAATSYIELDAEFHETLAVIAENSEVARAMSTLRQRIARAIADIVLHNRTLLVSSIAEHERILKALANADGEAAAGAMVEHLETGKRQFIERAPPEQRALLPARYQDGVYGSTAEQVAILATDQDATPISQTRRRTLSGSGSPQPAPRTSKRRDSTRSPSSGSSRMRTGSGRRLATNRTKPSSSRTASASTDNGSDTSTGKQTRPRKRATSASTQKTGKGSPGRPRSR